MEGSNAVSDHSSTDSDHWLNGFLQKKCEEARKRVQEERNLWNDENAYEDLDLSGIFNFDNYEESNGLSGEEILSVQKKDSSELAQTKPTPFLVGTTIHDEQTAGHVGIQKLREDGVTTLHEAHQCFNLSPAIQRVSSSNEPISIEDDKLRVAHDTGQTPSADHAPLESSNADWDFETELVEVASMGIVHSKQQLLQALNDFNVNVVERERANFRRTMKQIEETVNEVLEEVEQLDSSFKLRRMRPDSFYEVKSRSEVDILVVLENISQSEFVIEDMKTPTGFARIRVMSSSNMATSSDMTSPQGKLFHWCTETQSGEIYLSPKKLCKAFAALVSRAAGKILRNGSSVNRRRVSFCDTESSVPFTVNLIPTVACPQTWPLCAYWLRNYTKKWPVVGVKDDVICGGMHLVAVATGKEIDPLWRISFCSARRHLLQSDCEGKKKCLRILKVLVDKDLSRPKALVPLYLENIVLWASRKHWQREEWADNMLPGRFLEMLAALHKCLENNDCYNFFVPTMNLFNDLKPDDVKVLDTKVKDVLQDPVKYLKS